MLLYRLFSQACPATPLKHTSLQDAAQNPFSWGKMGIQKAGSTARNSMMTATGLFFQFIRTPLEESFIF
jgi:dipeptidase